jgi:hypothetical protein
VEEKKLYTLELPVTVIITVVQPVRALGRGIGVLLQIISYQLVIGLVKICGLRVEVEKVAQEDEDAKVYLADHALLFVNPVPVVVSLRVNPVPVVVSLVDHIHLFVSPVLVPIVVNLPVSLESLVVSQTENN